MQSKTLVLQVQSKNAADQLRDRLDQAVRNESGELGSWMILAAALAAAAVAVAALLGPWLIEKANSITAN